MTIKRYKFTRTFWEDHTDWRGCHGGTVVKLTKAHVTVNADVQDFVDLHSDAVYYAGFGGDDYAANRGIVLSARAMLKVLNADPFDPAEIAAETARADAAWEAESAKREKFRAEAAIARAAHPSIRAIYTDHAGRIVGVYRTLDLKVGARISTLTVGAFPYSEIIALGEEHRGNVIATVAPLDAMSDTREIKIEIC